MTNKEDPNSKINRDDAHEHPPFRILSLDGGGAKGFYTIGILEEIEAMVRQPLHKCFDLIFGTSTGAIIAALLARGESVANVKALYESHVPKIMGHGTSSGRSAALKKQADEIFAGERFDVFKTNIGIVATRWKDERPMIFKTSIKQAHGSKDSFQPGFGCTVSDVISASCSAYPFFDRFEIRTSRNDIVLVADGGFCANNPTLYAIADAVRNLKKPYDSLRVVSLGVGSYPDASLWKRALGLVRHWKLIRHVPSADFLQKILGTNTCSMETLRSILFDEVKTVRISDTFNEPDMATDFLEKDPKHLNRLIHKGRDSFSKNEQALRNLLLN